MGIFLPIFWFNVSLVFFCDWFSTYFVRKDVFFMKKLCKIMLICLILITGLLIPVHAYAAANVKFSDVKETDWFYPTVTRLVQKGHISGYTDGSFRPQNNIRVSEFTKILISAVGYQADSSRSGYWAEGCINKAKKLGIIKNGEFSNYDRYITRGEMARMIVRTEKIVKEKGITLNIPENYKEYASLITDYAYMDSDNQNIALKVFVSGIISGFPDGSFGFDKNATRAEASAIIIRFIEKDQRKVPVLPDNEYTDVPMVTEDIQDVSETDNSSEYSSSVQVTGEDDLTVTTRFKGSVNYVYPYWGMEYIMGPENTYYYAIYYGENGQVKYGEIIRQADDFVLERVYPDETYEEFTPPPLTEKQKQDFIDKYDPEKVKERIRQEGEESIKKEEENTNDLVKRNVLKITEGNMYSVYTYAKPEDSVLREIVRVHSEIYFGNTFENAYNFDVYEVEKDIVSQLNKLTLPVPLNVSIVPYKCPDFPEGTLAFEKLEKFDNQYGIRIILFNNENLSIRKQFEIQMENYFEEAEYIQYF